MGRISEFQSFDFHQDGALWVMAVLGVCFAGAFAALAVRKPDRFLLSIFVIVISLRSVRMRFRWRHCCCLPLANGSLVEVLSQASGLAWPGSAAVWIARSIMATASNLSERLFHGFAIVPVAAALMFLSIRTDAPPFPLDTFPGHGLRKGCHVACGCSYSLVRCFWRLSDLSFSPGEPQSFLRRTRGSDLSMARRIFCAGIRG